MVRALASCFQDLPQYERGAGGNQGPGGDERGGPQIPEKGPGSAAVLPRKRAWEGRDLPAPGGATRGPASARAGQPPGHRGLSPPLPVGRSVANSLSVPWTASAVAVSSPEVSCHGFP